jgi:cation diffusion facilitator CzcD-associated flavoprotein CzcO
MQIAREIVRYILQRELFDLIYENSILPYFVIRTNLPKEVMGFPDFPIPEGPESYLTRIELLDFLNKYCDHFALYLYIRVGA